MLAWSAEEAGRILETYKILEHKPPDLIMERRESDPHAKVEFISIKIFFEITYVCSFNF